MLKKKLSLLQNLNKALMIPIESQQKEQRMIDEDIARVLRPHIQRRVEVAQKHLVNLLQFVFILCFAIYLYLIKWQLQYYFRIF